MSSPPAREAQANDPSHTVHDTENVHLQAAVRKFGWKDNEAKYLQAHFSYMPTEKALYDLITRVTALPEPQIPVIIERVKTTTGRISIATLRRDCTGFIVDNKSCLPSLPTALKSGIKRGAYSGCWSHWQQWGTQHSNSAIRKHFELNKIPVTGPSFSHAISWVTKDIGDNFLRAFASKRKARENVKQHLNALNYLMKLQQKIVHWALGSGQHNLYQEDALDRHGETYKYEFVYFIHS